MSVRGRESREQDRGQEVEKSCEEKSAESKSHEQTEA